VNNPREGEGYIASNYILPLITNQSLSASGNNKVHLCFALVGMGFEFAAWLYPQMVGTHRFRFHAGDQIP
jgi:hypothetical protein